MSVLDVVIPNYQYGSHLSQCVESVTSQDVDDIRILIVDNASADNSVEVARRLVSQDPRIELVARSSNLGPHASFNEGVDWAQSDYFVLLCSDDLLPPGSLRRAIDILQHNPEVAFVYGREYTWDGQQALPQFGAESNVTFRRIAGRRFIERLCLPNVGMATGPAITRTKFQKQVGYFRPELRYTCDIELLMRLACLGDAAEVNDVQFVKRQHGENISAEYWGDWKAGLEQIVHAYDVFFEHEGAGLRKAAQLKWKIKRNIAQRAYWSAVSHRLRGLNSQSSALFTLSRSTYPLPSGIPPLSYWFKIESPGSLLAWKIRDLARAVGRSRETPIISDGPRTSDRVEKNREAD